MSGKLDGTKNMIQTVRQMVKEQLVKRQQKKYFKLLEEKTVTYDVWIKETEQKIAERLKGQGLDSNCSFPDIRQIPYEACEAYVTGSNLQKENAELVLFADTDGQLGPLALPLVKEYFNSHPEIALLYGDEDVMSPEGIRYTPWLKPDWSPDTFLSGFYFGSVFAVKTKALQELTEEEKQWIWQAENSDSVDGGRTVSEGKGYRSNKNAGNGNVTDENAAFLRGIRRLCFVLAEKSGGFQKRTEAEENFGFPIGHVQEILFHATANKEMIMAAENAMDVFADERAAGRKLSVIIPSKDNEEVLKRCILSLKKAAADRIECEIIVVDNGSSEETGQKLESWLGEIGAHYIYQKMPFHFSRMCNLGAEAASGEVLLFLNDDVEVPEQGRAGAGLQESVFSEKAFPENIYDAAKRLFTGAVGVKLYYPDSVRIQHAGIVNLRLGPVHKLQFKEDTVSYYYGWNRGTRNVIGVTGACLAVEKKKFEEIGGFPEELPVAFNDVDLCFSLFEKGYYNMVMQDTAFYHYESLSREMMMTGRSYSGFLMRRTGCMRDIRSWTAGILFTIPIWHQIC